MLDIFNCLYTAYIELPLPVDKDPELDQLIQTLLECEDKLTHRLSGEEQQLFLTFIDTSNDLSSRQSFDAFCAGVRIGAQLQRSILEED